MGAYLSAPILDKESEDGTAGGATPWLRHGASSMQGWRRSMEDAHIAGRRPARDARAAGFRRGRTRAGTDANGATIYGVFDGHGGAAPACVSAGTAEFSTRPKARGLKLNAKAGRRAQSQRAAAARRRLC